MCNQKTCCFTGNRPQKLPWGFNEKNPNCVIIKNKLAEEIEKALKLGYRHFISGMALGIDQFAFEIVMKKKKQYPDIFLEAAIPCEGQECKWSVSQKKVYNSMLDRSDKITIISPTYTMNCMMDRNKYMVDKSSLVIAVYNDTPGGTMKTIKYAQSKNVQTVIIKV